MKNDFSVLVTLHQREDIELNFNSLIESIYSNTLKPNYVFILIDGRIKTSFQNNIEDHQKIKGFKIYQHPFNIGLANILNIGLKKIKTTWIVRVDGDDICLSNRFKKIMDHAKSNLSIISSYILEIDQNQISRIKKVPISQDLIKKFIKYRNPFNHCAVAYQKDHVISVGGYPNIFLQEDYGLWVKMIAKGFQGMNIPEVLVHASFNGNSYTRRSGLAYLKSDIQMSMLKYYSDLINFFELIIVIFVRSIFILLPKFLKKWVYDLIRFI